jgi:hypothetical protein
VGARFSTPVQTGPGAHPASCTMGTGSFPGVKSSRGETLTPHPLLVLWSRKGRAIPLLPLWAVRPVQSLSACTRVHFTFSRHSLHCCGCAYELLWISTLLYTVTHYENWCAHIDWYTYCQEHNIEFNKIFSG